MTASRTQASGEATAGRPLATTSTGRFSSLRSAAPVMGLVIKGSLSASCSAVFGRRSELAQL